MAGGGGYGDPLARDPARGLAEVIAEKVSVARAASDYGVVIRVGDPPTVDEEASCVLRKQMKDAMATMSQA